MDLNCGSILGGHLTFRNRFMTKFAKDLPSMRSYVNFISSSLFWHRSRCFFLSSAMKLRKFRGCQSSSALSLTHLESYRRQRLIMYQNIFGILSVLCAKFFDNLFHGQDVTNFMIFWNLINVGRWITSFTNDHWQLRGQCLDWCNSCISVSKSFL